MARPLITPEQELWRVVPSVPQLLASSHGRVMVAPYWAPLPNGGQRTYGGEPNIGFVHENSRMMTIYKGKNYRVHRLVCEAFNGPPPPGTQCCMHLDEDFRNNRPENLKWGTQKQNLNAPGYLAYCSSRRGDHSPASVGQRIKEGRLNLSHLNKSFVSSL